MVYVLIDKIVVIDLETTDTNECIGAIVEVGVCELDLKTGETTKLLDSIISENIFGKSHHDAWIFQNSSLTVDNIHKYGVSWHLIKQDLQKILNKYPITAYNKQFDFKFLRHRRLDIKSELPCPMKVATHILKLPSHYGGYPYGGYKWPSFQEAWDYYNPDSDYIETHRAYDDAYHEALLIYDMYQKGDYTILDEIKSMNCKDCRNTTCTIAGVNNDLNNKCPRYVGSVHYGSK